MANLTEQRYDKQNEKLKAFLLLGCCLILPNILGGAKYPFLLLMALLVFLVKNKIGVHMLAVLIPPVTYVLVGSLSNLMNFYFSVNTVKQILFLLVPAISAVAIHAAFLNTNVDLIDVSFWCITLANSTSLLNIQSGDLAESQYAFIFGVFFMCYFLKKRRAYALLALILFILAHKRISLGAAALCMVCYFLFSHLNWTKRRLVKIIGILLIVVPYIYIYLIRSGMMMNIFYALNINTMGRASSWNLFINFYEFSPLFFGRGVGWVFDKLADINIATFGNLHNDFLVSFIECGFVGFGIWLSSYAYMLKFLSRRQTLSKQSILFLVMLIGYTFVNYTTDNILIYVNYWLPMNLIILEIYSKGVFNKDPKKNQ